MSHFGTDPGDLSPDEMYGQPGDAPSRHPVVPTPQADGDLEPFDRAECTNCDGAGCDACAGLGVEATRDELANYDPTPMDTDAWSGGFAENH